VSAAVSYPPTYTVSEHAQQRAIEMGLSTKDLKRAVQHPDTRYPGSKRHANGATCYQRGNIVVVANDETHVIITVLFHRANGRVVIPR